jgi:4-hydroxyphenylpyruvate dioxygenase
MNVIVNAQAGTVARPEAPMPAAVALRVRDAAAAHAAALGLGLGLGAWDVPVQVAPMELHILAIHGAGASGIYFVDRHREFSI